MTDPADLQAQELGPGCCPPSISESALSHLQEEHASSPAVLRLIQDIRRLRHQADTDGRELQRADAEIALLSREREALRGQGMKMDRVEIDALMQESQDVRESAGRLLREMRIVEQWEPYGAVEFIGAYRWDLMLTPDVDLRVVNPDADLDLALTIFTRFARQGDFLAFGFIDSVRGKPAWADPATYPEGYYIGMAKHFEGREWKVETFLVRDPPPRLEWMETEMTPDRRRAIMGLKHLRRTGQLHACGFDIYRAVLLGGAEEPQAVDAWLRHCQGTACSRP